MEFKNLKQIEEFAKEAIQKDWIINGNIVNISDRCSFGGFNNRRKSVGLCTYYRDKGKIEIHLSKPIIKLNIDNSELIKDTILHELAHAIQYYQLGWSDHGSIWKSIAKNVGAKPIRIVGEPIETPKGKYTLKCPSCKNESTVYRKPKRDKACGKCCNGVYNEKYKLELIQNY